MHSLSTEIYKLTRTFPREELYGLVSQIRRAAVSIASNIAEGYGRSSNTELIHFLYIALGSSNEVDTQLVVAMNVGYITKEQYEFMGRNERRDKCETEGLDKYEERLWIDKSFTSCKARE